MEHKLDLPVNPSTTPGRIEQQCHYNQASRAALAVARLDAWLDTMRGPGGYGGPVAHWWRQSMIYTGAGLDWRYEGIIAGYLTLWKRSGEKHWLAKARRAGDDLLAGQQENSHFAASAFEINPASAGTPHEAACDVALLLLARALRNEGVAEWQLYASAAERNLRSFYIDQLWDSAELGFRDSVSTPSFVPNKAATACDALFLLAELSGDESILQIYVRPTLERILSLQIRGQGLLDGAIAQNVFSGRLIASYFPIYIARCVPALLHGYQVFGDERFFEGACRAMSFIARLVRPDGSLPTVVYSNKRANIYPSWIAPLGDVLRANDLLRPYGYMFDLATTEQRLLAGQDSIGGIRTAQGFAGQSGGRPPSLPDLRDILHIAGWCDKAFRYLVGMCDPQLSPTVVSDFEADCTFRGAHLHLCESANVLEIRRHSKVTYRWYKGEPTAQPAAVAFWAS